MEALDGNAIAGILYHVFSCEMTMALAECGRCGARGPVAECEVYLGGPGVVVRCRVCHNIVMVLVEVREMVCVDRGGLSELRPGASDQRQPVAEFADRRVEDRPTQKRGRGR